MHSFIHFQSDKSLVPLAASTGTLPHHHYAGAYGTYGGAYGGGYPGAYYGQYANPYALYAAGGYYAPV